MSGPPFHIRARKEDIAGRAIIVGDPRRVEHLSTLLENSRVVNTNRGLLTVTGTYKGVPITIATHGIGGPSAAIVIEELAMLGSKVIVRIGTAGGMTEDLDVGRVLVVSGAAYYCGGNAVGMYIPNSCFATAPHPEVTYKLMKSLKSMGIEYRIGPVISSDAFYAEDPEFVKRWSSRGVVAVEMECACLFSLGWMRRIKTGAVVVISDNLVKEEKYMATAEELREIMLRVGRAVLEALIDIDTRWDVVKLE